MSERRSTPLLPSHQPESTDTLSEGAAGGGRGREIATLLVLTAVSLCTLWLSVTGHLTLYVNPRYVAFTTILAAVGAVASVVACAWVVAAPAAALADHGHDHGAAEKHGHGARSLRPRRRLVPIVLAGSGVVVTTALTIAMLVLPPSALSATTAEQRDVNSGTFSSVSSGASSVTLARTADTASYGVKDWAALIQQTTDPTALVGTRVTETGFVTRDPHDADSFYLTRFVISCCAVDAQPVALVVRSPGWASTVKVNDWVTVTGSFQADTTAGAGASVVIAPTATHRTSQPHDPYEY